MEMNVRASGPHIVADTLLSPVSSHNEWDPLEEIIVGRLENSVFPSAHPVVTCNIPGAAAWGQRLIAGSRYPSMMVEPARRELDGLVRLLESLGIIVTRPEPIDDRMLKITSLCGKWLCMNVLAIDEKRIIVDPHHTTMMRAMERWGFEPIPCPFPASRGVRRRLPLRDPRRAPSGNVGKLLLKHHVASLRPTIPASTSAMLAKRSTIAGSPNR